MAKPCQDCGRETENGNRRCSKCALKHYKTHHPLGYRHRNIRARARTRNQPFEISISEFRAMTPDSVRQDLANYHLDRIDPLQGYTLTNVRWISTSQNLSKSYHDKLVHQFADHFSICCDAQVTVPPDGNGLECPECNYLCEAIPLETSPF